MERKESIKKDATSKETLEDLEDNEKQVDESDDSTLPSPDGTFDESDIIRRSIRRYRLRKLLPDWYFRLLWYRLRRHKQKQLTQKTGQ